MAEAVVWNVETILTTSQPTSDNLANTGVGYFHCNNCPSSFSSIQAIQRHGIVHIRDLPHKCKYCSATFRTLAGYNVHLLVHKKAKVRKPQSHKVKRHFYLLSNKSCKFSSPSKTCPYEKLKACTVRLERLKGNVCKWLLKGRRVLFGHSQCGRESIHLPDNSPQVTGEDDYFSRQDKLSSDFNWELHNQFIPDTDAGYQRMGKLFKCNECPYTEKAPSLLRKHVQCHSNDLFYKCDYCSASFTKLTAKLKHLKLHTHIHSSELPLNQSYLRKSDDRKTELYEQLKHFNENIEKLKQKQVSERPYLCVPKKNVQSAFNSNYSELDSNVARPADDNCRTDLYSPSDEEIVRSNEAADYTFVGRSEEIVYREDSFCKTVPQLLDDSGFTRVGYYYKCNECPLTDCSAKKIRKHVQLHVCDSPFKCQFCSASFMTKTARNSHKRIHSLIYGCKFENQAAVKKFHRQKKLLYGHLNKKRVYERLRSLKTSLNSADITNNNELGHIKKPDDDDLEVHSEKPVEYSLGVRSETVGSTNGATESVRNSLEDSRFTQVGNHYKCNECPSIRGSIKGIKKHVQCHVDNLPFKCDLCSASFATAAGKGGHKMAHRRSSAKLCTLKTSAQRKKLMHGQVKLCKDKIDQFNHYWVTDEQLSLPDGSVQPRLVSNNTIKNPANGDSEGLLNCPVETKEIMRTENIIEDVSVAVQSSFITRCELTVMCAEGGSQKPVENSLEYSGFTVVGNYYRCNECPFTTTQALRILSHVEVHKRRLTYKCNYCSASFKFLGLLKSHELLHNKSLPVGEKCNRRQPSRKCCTANIGCLKSSAQSGAASLVKDAVSETILHPEVVLPINSESKQTTKLNEDDQNKVDKFSCSENFYTHRKTYTCNECHASLPSKQEILCHVRVHCQKQANKNVPGISKSLFCNLCRKKFKKVLGLRSHLRACIARVNCNLHSLSNIQGKEGSLKSSELSAKSRIWNAETFDRPDFSVICDELANTLRSIAFDHSYSKPPPPEELKYKTQREDFEVTTKILTVANVGNENETNDGRCKLGKMETGTLHYRIQGYKMEVIEEKETMDADLNEPVIETEDRSSLTPNEEQLSWLTSAGFTAEWVCKVCFCILSVKTRSRAFMHAAIHKRDLPYKCKYCVSSFVQLRYLKRHVSFAHKLESEERDSTGSNTLKRKWRSVKDKSPSNCAKKLSLSPTEQQTELCGNNQAAASKDYSGTTAGGESPVLVPELQKYEDIRKLESNISHMLIRIVDKDTLLFAGWPSVPLEKLLCSVMRACGLIPAKQEGYSRAEWLEVNCKMMFIAAIGVENVATILKVMPLLDALRMVNTTGNIISIK